MKMMMMVMMMMMMGVAGEGFAQVDTLWTHIYGQRNYPVMCSRMIQTADQGFLIGGSMDEHGFNRFKIVKVDSAGAEDWERVFHFGSHDNLQSIAQTPDNGFVLSGQVIRWGNPSTDENWIAKVDSAGDLLWARAYSDDGVGFQDIKVNSSGQIIVTGDDNQDFWLVCLDQDGQVLWDQHYGGRGVEAPFRVIQTKDGGYLLVGWSNSYAGPSAYAVKVDSSGNEEWHNVYGGEGQDVFYSVVEKADGHYIFSGFSDVDNVADTYLVKTESNGEEVWSRTYHHLGSDYGWDVLEAPSNGYLVIGENQDLRPDSYHRYTATRVDTSGQVLWNFDIGPQPSGIFKSGLLLEDGSYAFAGTHQMNPPGYGFWLVRTTPDTSRGNGVRLLDPAFPSLFALDVPYPNPFNGSTTLSFTLGAMNRSPAGLRVYDGTGRLVSELAREQVSVGRQSIVWNAAGLPGGVYLVRLEAAGEAVTRQVTLLR